MKNLVQHLKSLALISAIPFVMFWTAILLSFVIYPDDVDGASNLIMILSGTGCLMALFFVVQNIRNIWRDK